MKIVIHKNILLIFFFLVTSYNVAQAFSGPDTFADLAEKVSPSVVNISTTGVIEQSSPQIPSIEDFFNFPFNMPSPEQSEREFSSLGSGFVISEDGYIVTNNHVVQNASDIQVTFIDSLKLEAELIAFCKDNISSIKSPRSIDFQEELPRHPTGKLYKRLLKDKYWK